jgi:hypothetical protein
MNIQKALHFHRIECWTQSAAQSFTAADRRWDSRLRFSGQRDRDAAAGEPVQGAVTLAPFLASGDYCNQQFVGSNPTANPLRRLE